MSVQPDTIRKVASASSLSATGSDSDDLSISEISPDIKSAERSVSRHARSTRANTAEDLDVDVAECAGRLKTTALSVPNYRGFADEAMTELKKNALVADNAWVLKRQGANYEIFIRPSASPDVPVTMKAVRKFKCSAQQLFQVLSMPEKWDKQIDQREKVTSLQEQIDVFYTATKAVSCFGVTLIASRDIVTLRACYELDAGKLLIEAGVSLDFDVSRVKISGRNHTRAKVFPGSGAVVQALDANSCVLHYVVCTDLGGSLSASNKNLGYIISEVAPGQLVTFLDQVQVGVDNFKK